MNGAGDATRQHHPVVLDFDDDWQRPDPISPQVATRSVQRSTGGPRVSAGQNPLLKKAVDAAPGKQTQGETQLTLECSGAISLNLGSINWQVEGRI